MPWGVPGSQKARSVIKGGQRLSAGTYLKGPSVFGFNGVYKPFAVDSGVTGPDLNPGPRAADLARSWEIEQGFPGFTDWVPQTEGGRLRTHIRDQVLNALRAGRCTTNTGSWLFGQLTGSLHPDHARPREQRALRSLVVDDEHEHRAELAFHIDALDGEFENEADLLAAVRPLCSEGLGQIVDAVATYEEFASLVDNAFRMLCAISHAMGTQPMTAAHVVHHEQFAACASDIPERYMSAYQRMAAIEAESRLEEQLGEFAIPRPPGELFELVLAHHRANQATKPPNGKRPWFEPVRDGWVVRAPYGKPDVPVLEPGYVHPVRVAALRRFLQDTEI
jgi:hypothetical protein